jgi:copper chaperone CopZ
MQKELTLSIHGMRCEGCVQRVTAALQRINGVEVGSVEVGRAQTAFDSNRTSAREIAAAVSRIGFPAHVEK